MTNTITHAYNTRSAAKGATIQLKMPRANTYKENESSDDSSSCDEDDLLSEDEDDFIVKDKKQLNPGSFQHLLAELFPSKYMAEKTNKLVTKDKAERKYSRYEREMGLSPRQCTPEGSSTPIECPSPPRKVRASKTKTYKVEEDAEEKSSSPTKLSNFNIIFTINPTNMPKDKKIEDYEDYHSSDDPDYNPEDEMVSEAEDSEEDAGSDEESEGWEDIDADEEEAEASANEDEAEASEAEEDDYATQVEVDSEDEDMDVDLNVKTPKKGNNRNKNNKREKTSYKQQARLCKKRKFKNALKFKALLQQKNVMNDLNYFQEKMSLDEQETVLQQMTEIKALIDIEKPYRLALLEANIPARFKACAYNKLSTLKNMEPGSSEYNKIKHWVDDFMRIPFNKINHLPVTIDDGVEKCHDFMADAKNTLDKAVYGLDDVKLQVMQMVGQWITNPDAIGNSVAIEGPPGTGKTTLVKEGISKILNREFVFIPLGGATDSSCLEGHSYTYEGSNCGLIVKQLIQCQSMNPIIYFDELDKISDTPKGDEIVGILTHLTDTSQNSSFHDKYFAEFNFDLSRCVFFFSYNDRSKVNRILLDRMHCIMTKGYELPQKTIISKDYLLPVIREQVRFKEGEIILPDETIQHIINTHTHKEDGVRNLKRCLEIIHTKLNLYRLMRPDMNLFEKDMAIKVEFPITITPQLVDKLIKRQSETGAWQNMYM